MASILPDGARIKLAKEDLATGSVPFARNNTGVVPQFVPDENTEIQPVGSAESQVEEAMRIAKELNSRPEVGMGERIAKMDAMNVSTATDFLDGLSPYEREKYLLAEKMSKGRKQVLGRYGQ